MNENLVDDILVPKGALQIGDVIVALDYGHRGAARFCTYSGALTVTKLNPLECVPFTPNPSEIQKPTVTGIWIRARGKTAERDQGTNRFPHNCPRCGQPAYVGLSVVEHPEESPCRSL